MTPYELTLLIHYHTRADEPDDYITDTELRRDTIEMFVTQLLVTPVLSPASAPGREANTAKYRTTQRAGIYLEAVLALPLPVWRMPE